MPMKIGGKVIDSKPASELIVFPRQGGDIAIRCNAVMDREPFDKLVPVPKPPKKRVKGGDLVDDEEHPKHVTAMQQHAGKFMDWLIITSLCGINAETNEDEPIEWEKVQRSDPSTWNLWDQELKENGFSDMDRKRLYALVMNVNSLSDQRLDEARESFLRRQAAANGQSSSPTADQQDTPSGELANASGFVRPVSLPHGKISQKSQAGGSEPASSSTTT